MGEERNKGMEAVWTRIVKKNMESIHANKGRRKKRWRKRKVEAMCMRVEEDGNGGSVDEN